MGDSNKPIRWSIHAEDALVDRMISREAVLFTLTNYEFRVPDRLPPKEVLMRRYIDPDLQRLVLLRVVIEETPLEIAIVTVYKATRIDRYLKGLLQ